MARKHKPRRKNPPQAGSRAARLGAKRAARTRARNHAKRVRAGKKAARTRKRKHGGGRKTSRKSGKRHTRKHKRSKHKRKSPSRVAAGRKAAATRKRRAENKKLADDPNSYAYESRKKRKKRRKNPVSAAAEAPRRKRGKRKAKRSKARSHKRRRSGKRKSPGHHKHHVRRHYRKVKGKKRRVLVKGHRSHEEPKRRKRRKNPRRRAHHRRHKNPRRRRNPITGPMEMLMAVLGVAFGYVGASAADRFAATHALSASGGAGGVLTDTPPAGGIYNSEVLSLPIWSSWQRIAAGVASVGAPLVVASFVKSGAAKSFWQLAGFAALARTAGKAADDGIAVLAGQVAASNPTLAPMLVQLYAPELAAQTAVNTLAGGQKPAAGATSFAGLPSGRRTLGDLPPGYVAPTYTPVEGGNPTASCPPGFVMSDAGCAPAPSPPTNVLPPAVNLSIPIPVPTIPPFAPPSGGGGGGDSGGPSPMPPAPPPNYPPSMPTTPIYPPSSGSQPIPMPPQPTATPFNPLFSCPDDCD